MLNQLKTPVAFLIFNRPEETRKVFDVIKKARPETLLIVADGPRINKIDDGRLCKDTRSIVDKIDWPCRVLRNYSDVNLGCKIRVSSGLDWVFENVESAIILEDDCLPSESFFPFCEQMIEKYKDNQKVMHIGGFNVQEFIDGTSSYYFSNIAQIWGWATWRRAWKKYDVSMNDWPEISRSGRIEQTLKNPQVADYFKYIFGKMHDGKYDTWDVAWTYTCMKENGLCIVPNTNLIKNIGYNSNATHKNKGDFGEVSNRELTFPLVHPPEIMVDSHKDSVVYRKVFGINSNFKQKILWLIKSNFPSLYYKLRSLTKNK